MRSDPPDRLRRLSRGMAVFCFVTLIFLAYRDLTIPAVRETEVWFGFELRGLAALWTAPLHWVLYAIGGFAFWRGHRWVWRAAMSYSAYIALSHLIWNLTSPHGGGFVAGCWQLGLFSIPAILFWSIDRRSDPRPRESEALERSKSV